MRKLGTTFAPRPSRRPPRGHPRRAGRRVSTYEWRVTAIDVDGRFPDAGRLAHVHRRRRRRAPRTRFASTEPASTTPAAVEAAGGTSPASSTAYQWRHNGQRSPAPPDDVRRAGPRTSDATISVVATGTSLGVRHGHLDELRHDRQGRSRTGRDHSPPQIVGTGKVGHDPHLDRSDVGPDVHGGTTLQWMRNGVITGATSSTYAVVAGDLNASITLHATGTLPGRTPNGHEQRHHRGQGPPPWRRPASIHGAPQGRDETDRPPRPGTSQGCRVDAVAARRPAHRGRHHVTTYAVRPEDVDAALSCPLHRSRPGTRRGRRHQRSRNPHVLGDAPVAHVQPGSPVGGAQGRLRPSPRSVAPTWSLNGVQR